MSNHVDLCSVFRRRPVAVAFMNGSPEYASIKGKVLFYQTENGVVVRAEITGLPKESGICDDKVFAFHIHEGTECSGNETDAFASSGGHYNPDDCQHPYHAGDMPPLFAVNGTAYLAFITGRFNVTDILGKTVIIHSHPDDFMTQPSGNAGQKIACGVITPTARRF